ncbi:MAG: O-antigen ligase family protein [Candidatus Polarisedimenticolaceae bacterium]|nr:O-antigen ligase family protein [Candidatus Polarisedimenticolaceae bacterium]
MPFYQFSVIGSFSVDNILAPVLLFAWFAQMTVGGGSVAAFQATNIVKSIVVAVFYFIAHIIGLIGTQEAVWHSAYLAATNMLYFILPILFIRSLDDLKRFKDAVIIVAIIASISGLLSALGIIELEFARQAESRIGVESLQKSIGVFSSYGDVGILLSLALLTVIARHKEKGFFLLKSYFGIGTLIVICLIAIISMQSRNIVLTIIAALLAYWMIGHLMKISKNWNYILYAVISLAAAFSITIVALFSAPLLEFVQGIGGTKEAAGTVSNRLEQYGVMWDLVKDRVWIGVDPSVYEKRINEINLTHNIWLKELVQGGIITVLAMLMIFWRALMVQVANYRRGCESKDVLVFLSCVIGMLVATQFYPGGTLVFWCILGACSTMPLVVDKKITEKIENKFPHVLR